MKKDDKSFLSDKKISRFSECTYFGSFMRVYVTTSYKIEFGLKKRETSLKYRDRV